MSTEKKIKTNIQTSTLNSSFDALSKWHNPHITQKRDSTLSVVILIRRTASWTRRECQKWYYGLKFIIKKKTRAFMENRGTSSYCILQEVSNDRVLVVNNWPCAAAKEKKRLTEIELTQWSEIENSIWQLYE